MKRHPFGSTKHQVSVIGQGTWHIETADRRSAIAALRRGLDLGMIHIDTAEMYGSGVAEEVVAEAIIDRRDQVFLVSKVLPQHASRSGTVVACENSLARLKTDRLDCYLLHWRGSHPLEETIAGFESLQREGKIRSWGVSNFDVADLEEAESVAGEGRLACNQVLYHLKERWISKPLFPGASSTASRSLAIAPSVMRPPFMARGQARAAYSYQIAAAHDATARQVALSFLVRRPSLFAIPKASSPEHAAENAGAGDLELTKREIELIDQGFPLDRRHRRLPMG